MRIVAQVAEGPLAEKVEMAIDAEFEGARYVLEFATDAEDLNGLLKTTSCDVVLVFTDPSQKRAMEALEAIDARKVDAPVVALYAGGDTQTLFNILAKGCVSATPYTDGLRKGTIAMLVENAFYAFGGRTRTKQFGPIAIDYPNRVVRVDGVPLHLTGKEFAMFSVLSNRPGNAISKERLYAELYGVDGEVELKILDVFICKIRKKFDDVASGLGTKCIQTVWGEGYSFNSPDGQTALPRL